jgi:release factor glutamine methyltransferase
MSGNTKHQTLNRSFARRIGKKLSQLKQDLVDNELPKHIFTPEKLENSKFEKTFLEIGFGMGEHFVHQVTSNPENLYIGAEVYINGVANALKQIKNLENFMLWANDFDLIMNEIPANSLDGIYVLFPDPWHKNRALKKRIFNQTRLLTLKKMLKKNGFIAFASDIEDYFKDACALLEQDPDLSIQNTDSLIPHPGYIQTKYHSKAIKEGRRAQFVQGVLL